MQRAKERLIYVIPFTLLVIFLLLYVNFKSIGRCAIVLLAVPFSMIGAIWLLYLLGYNLSVAVWVGIIALAGVDAETGVIMLLYLEQAYEKSRGEGRMQTLKDLHEAIIEGAVKRIAAPMIGGVVTSFLLELLVYPAIFEIWRGWRMRRTPGGNGLGLMRQGAP